MAERCQMDVPLADIGCNVSFLGWRLTLVDPKRSISLLQTGQSAKSRFCELEFSEAVAGDLTQPASNGH
jgi:hypothetical protein